MDGTTAAAVLGISERADLESIRAAFRAQVKVDHPDRGGDAVDFVRTLTAFETLVQRQPGASVDPASIAPLGATHGFDGFDASWPRRPVGDRRSFADELRVALAREASAPRR